MNNIIRLCMVMTIIIRMAVKNIANANSLPVCSICRRQNLMYYIRRTSCSTHRAQDLSADYISLIMEMTIVIALNLDIIVCMDLMINLIISITIEKFYFRRVDRVAV